MGQEDAKPTPRTDATEVEVACALPWKAVPAHFARQLERELSSPAVPEGWVTVRRCYEAVIVELEGWAHDGRLQTFEDRERFRKWVKENVWAIRALSAIPVPAKQAQTEPDLLEALDLCVNLLSIWKMWTPDYCTAYRDFESLPEIQKARAALANARGQCSVEPEAKAK